jgi:hypothetical protein
MVKTKYVFLIKGIVGWDGWCKTHLMDCLQQLKCDGIESENSEIFTHASSFTSV